MFGDSIAKTIRSFNSEIISTRPGFRRKLLKVSLLLSFKLSKRVKGEDREQVIDNFDSDIRLVVNTSRTMGKAIFWTGFHELKELMFLHQFLRPESVFVDIGANMGEYALFAAKRVPLGRVIAYEPLPRMRLLLEKNRDLNGFKNITVVPIALSDKPGRLKIFEVKDVHEGLATIFPGDRESESAVEVELRTLDDEIASSVQTARVDFVKLDIEGSELFALRGARETIRRFRPHVMVEINESTYKNAGYSRGEVKAFFDGLSYQPFELDKEARLVPCKELPVFGNLIFRPE